MFMRMAVIHAEASASVSAWHVRSLWPSPVTRNTRGFLVSGTRAHLDVALRMSCPFSTPSRLVKYANCVYSAKCEHVMVA